MSNIDFYFDFLSPYAYLASTRVEAVAPRHGCAVRWRPFRLGVAVVKAMGLRPNMETPLKGPYILRDTTRLAQVLGLPLAPPPGLPNPLPPAQLFYGAPSDVAPQLAKALFQAHWAEGQDIGDPTNLVRIATAHGMSEAEAQAALTSAQTRQALTDQTNEALARGVFGSPTFAVDEELYWGVDRLWLLEHYLASGGRYAPLSTEEQVHQVGELR